jgi:hypothetical protein
MQPKRAWTLGLLAMVAAGLACIIEDLRFVGRPCSETVPCGGGTICDSGRCIARVGTDGPTEMAIVDRLIGEPADLPPPSDQRLELAPKVDRPTDSKRLDQPKPVTDRGPCSPACSGTTPVCCKTATPSTYGCAKDLSSCICDPASGDPCSGTPFPVCCTTSAGPDPHCQAAPSGCICNASTGNPCFGSVPKCCKKGTDTDPHCYVDNTGCL